MIVDYKPPKSDKVGEHRQYDDVIAHFALHCHHTICVGVVEGHH